MGRAVHTEGERSATGSWKAQAACLGLPQGLFFADREESRIRGEGAPYYEGRQVCAQCRVSDDCLTYAMRSNQQFGLWGGLNVVERNRLRRKARRSA